jgi:iron complex transport system substrate-binding protein
MFDIRYSFREHGKFIILELPTVEELAKHLRHIMLFLASCLLCVLLPAVICFSSDSGRYVVDLAGRRVLIPQKVHRVITTGANAAVNTFILAIGKGKTIKNGRPFTASADKRWKYQLVFAPFLANQPVVSASSGMPNPEALIAIPHDLIFEDNAATTAMLEEKGFTVVSLNWKDPKCVQKTMALMGEIFDQRDRVQEFEQYYQRNLSRVSAQIKSVPDEKRPRVLYIQSKSMALFMPSTASRLITLAGGRYGVTGKIPEYALFSMEHLIVWDPDILLVSGGLAQVESIYQDPRYSLLKAVKNRKVYVVPCGSHLWANNTPEQAICILWLAKIIYPDRFGHINITEETKHFYDKFFGYRLSDAQIKEILTQETQ